MRISTLFFTIGQGIKNIFRNKLFSLATVATIASCVFLFGLFYCVVLNFQNFVREIQTGVAITVFFDEGLPDAEIMKIGDEIAKRTEVSKIVFISAEEAWESFKSEELGGYVDSFGDDNPLQDDANFEIYMNDVSRQETLVKFIEGLEGVRQVRKSVMVASVLTSMNNFVGYISMAIILILLLVSIFLISNTVSIGITVRREEIGIMKLIGATDFVVRAPFVIEGIILGLIGAAIPLAAIYYVYRNVVEYISERFNIISSFLKFLTINQIFSTLMPVSLTLGVGIGFLGSFTTVRKHLRV
ncbi:MAG: permease-like cell division protein FtsX [Lachnospiraceae bacterium]|nr:permease-like cell division protein FtsX [Lachnospiraceae bacterium]